MDDEPINILVVDDQPGKLLGYQAILEQLHENLLMARSAREALEILLKEDVALILIDVCMPELDGFELAEVIRTHPRFEKTAIMFVSGVNLTDLDRLRGYSAGAVDYVSVPVVPEILRAKVRVFADLHRKSRQLEVLNRELEDRIAARTAALEASTARWQESEERLRLALAAARAGAWEWRIGSEEMTWSPELFGLLGLPGREDPTVEDLVEAAHPEDRERVRALLTDLPTHAGRFDLEFRVGGRDGRPDAPVVWMQTTGEVVHMAGRPSVARGIVQDVTSRKVAEIELASEARRKDEFLATLAHELRNPLAPIATGVRLLSSARAPEALRGKTLGILDRQVSHLVRLVDDLMDVSRISRGAITLHREPLDVAELVRSTLDASGLASSGLEIACEAPAEGPFVQGDRVRLAQVVANLLDNAAKFTPTGGRITLEVTGDGPEVAIVVRDTGVGIAEGQVDRVFELFAQVSNVPDGRGLGIGLAVVRQLIELHDGSVSARSDGRGKGTEITVRLPRIEAPEPVAPPTSPSGSEPPEPGAEAGRTRFLVVDDNVDAATLLAQQLTLAGYVARAAFGGEEATALGAEVEPDVVLLDLGMPVVDGFETARRMRLTPWGKAAKLVALTGWGQASDRQKTTEAGFDGHLVKPVDLEAVLGLVRRGE